MSEAAFQPEALAANQGGQLSDPQRDHLKDMLAMQHGGLAGLVGRAVDPIAWDVKAGRVESIEGAILKQIVPAAFGAGLPGEVRRELRLTKLDGGRVNYFTSAPLHEYAQDASMVRLFYLPRSHWVVNLERLPDPAPAATTGRSAVEIAQGGAFVRDVESYLPDPDTVARQQPAAADAIVGSWTSPFGTLDFGAGGTLNAKLGDGSAYQGQWSLDAEGRLHADMMGTPMVAEVTVADDRLTLLMDGQALELRRTGG